MRSVIRAFRSGRTVCTLSAYLLTCHTSMRSKPFQTEAKTRRGERTSE